VTVVTQQCSKQLTISCGDALTAVEPPTRAALGAIDKNTVPLCIAPQVAKVRLDIAGLDSAAQVANGAFAHNKASELAFAMGTYVRYAAALRADQQAVARASTTQCDARVTGP
jgi:hypothetical protein